VIIRRSASPPAPQPARLSLIFLIAELDFGAGDIAILRRITILPRLLTAGIGLPINKTDRPIAFKAATAKVIMITHILRSDADDGHLPE